MSKDKNFKIVRNANTLKFIAGDIKIGDVFEREGSLHMRILPTGLLHAGQSSNEVAICNLNTGSAWIIPANTQIYTCHNVTMDYQVNK
jgi:hypothetical protein